MHFCFKLISSKRQAGKIYTISPKNINFISTKIHYLNMGEIFWSNYSLAKIKSLFVFEKIFVIHHTKLHLQCMDKLGLQTPTVSDM